MKPIYYKEYYDWYDGPLVFSCYDENTKYVAIAIHDSMLKENAYGFVLYPISDNDFNSFLNGKLDLGKYCLKHKEVLLCSFGMKNDILNGDVKVYHKVLVDNNVIVTSPYYLKKHNNC